MIRNITKDDTPFVIQLMKEFYSSPAVLHKVNENNFINTVDEALNDSPYVKILVCEIDEKIAGYCQLSLSYSNEAGGLNVFIEELMIHSSYRHQGLGTAFLEYVFTLYKDAKRFRLEVTKDNRNAYSLYEKTGFKTLDYIQMIIDKEV